MLLVFTLVISCQSQLATTGTQDDYDFVDDLSEEIEKDYIEIDRGYELSAEDFEVVVTGTEGEMIRLDPRAIDPDGDDVTFYFSEPFDESGRWQTVYITNARAQETH